jgi:hypothetical protein
MASQMFIIEQNEKLLPMENILEDIINAGNIEIDHNSDYDKPGKFYLANMADWQDLNGRLIYLSSLIARAKAVLKRGVRN